MPIENIVWILPRPKRDHYKGGFPLWFEEKLLKLYGYDYHEDVKDRVVQLFAGMTQYGYRVDVSPEVKPDYIGDAHDLPASWTDRWELAICDPPYNEEYSKTLYGTSKPRYKQYIAEAVRIVKPGGYIASYHYVITPRPQGTTFHRRIFVGGRVWHKLRVCCMFQKSE